MQVAERVKPAQQVHQSNALTDDIYAPSLSEKSDKVKVQEANMQKLKRANNLRRILEANSDCV